MCMSTSLKIIDALPESCYKDGYVGLLCLSPPG
jgi:hypothetical protein